MRTKLTTEQSLHLVKLGVPTEMASEIEEYDDSISQWTHRGAPIFTLTDILDILPKEIEQNNKSYNLVILGFDSYWYADYVHGKHYLSLISEYELIDALYELICWYYGEHLKSEK